MAAKNQRVEMQSVLTTSKQSLGMKDLPLAVPISSASFNFIMQRQLRSKWCWSAVATSVALFYDAKSPWTQCSLASDQLGQPDCCQNNFNIRCNQPWRLELALKAVKHFAGMMPGLAPPMLFKDEIQENRPVCVRIEWQPNEGPGHFAAVRGYVEYINSEFWFHIEDPDYGYSFMHYDEFHTRYQGNGTVTDTYVTRP